MRLTKKAVGEAARVLKSSDSKPNDRRQAAQTMSLVGSSKGGQQRAQNLTDEQRTEIARLGGLARQAARRQALKKMRARSAT